MEYRNVWTIGTALVVFIGLILALKPDIATSLNGLPVNGKVTLPQYSMEVSPGVYYLGTSLKDGKMLEGYAIIDHRKGFGKPTGCNYDGKCSGWEDGSCADCKSVNESDSGCFSIISRGAKWKVDELYLLNPNNFRGMNPEIVTANFSESVIEWESAAGIKLIDSMNLTNDSLSADTFAPDGINEIYFGDVEERNAIAITVIWGVFRGPISQREISEYDIVFDQADYDWSVEEVAGKMNFKNIAMHEVGHALGLDDVYDARCSDATMYGYADFGETKKQTLEAGDVQGIMELYGYN